MATIHEIARMVGVSPALVSLALNGKPRVSPETAEKIIRAAKKIGYRRPADRIAKNMTVRFVRFTKAKSFLRESHAAFFAEYTEGAEQYLNDQGCRIEVSSHAGDKLPDIVHSLEDAHLQGAIVLATELSPGDMDAFSGGVPLVFLDVCHHHLPRDYCTMNNHSAVFLIVRHLCGMGHREIGLVASSLETGNFAERTDAFQRMLVDCRAGKIDMVITKSITRFARNTVTLLETARELKLLGIDILFEKENIRTLSADGEFMLTLLASFAQEESRSASENQKWRIKRMFEQGRPNTGKMLGYRLIDGQLYIVPEEAELVKQIFADYLAGMGKYAIAKKLNLSGVPTRNGGLWRRITILQILRNEKYTGDLLLQKTFRPDHISKRKCYNRGELPQYHIENSHEPIISKDMFEQVQLEIAKRSAKHPPATAKTEYPFTNRLVCEQCGRNYHRKHAAAGTKYKKIVWICHTFNIFGKEFCSSQQIPENILEAKTAEVLGLPAFDEAAFKEQITEIRIPTHNRLTFIFSDGRTVDTEWRNPSRSESWTEEMKQKAREKSLILAERRRNP